jgi:hypothetical protein
MKNYTAIDGQSIFDVCLQTYGSLDFLGRLIVDSAFDNVNTSPFSGQVFSYDPDLLQDQVIGGNKAGKLATLYSPAKVQSGTDQQLTLITKRYATDASRIILPPISINQMYQKADADSYTAGIDGETVIPLPQWIGWDVLSVEDEIKPLKKSEYAWNKSSGTLALQGGLTLGKDQTLFFLFTKMTTQL